LASRSKQDKGKQKITPQHSGSYVRRYFLFVTQDCDDIEVKQGIKQIDGESPSGKAPDFDSGIRRFDPYLPSQIFFGAQMRPSVFFRIGRGIR
jgi:hypothetical protein